MAKYNPSNIRNVAFLGHQSSGKTTLVESLYFVTGGTTLKGEVEKKNTVSDYLPDEQRKQTSIQTAVVPVFYRDNKINLLDIPGNDDFLGEALGTTEISQGAVLVVDGSVGVQMGTIKHWNLLRRKGIPTLIFVNKMDKPEAKFDEVLEEIKEKLGKNAVPFEYPLGHGDAFDGFVNIVDLTAVKDNGKESKKEALNDDKKAKVADYRAAIEEAVAGTSDELLEKYFMGEPLTDDEIKAGLKAGVTAGELVPVLVGNAKGNIGVHTLLDMMLDFFPSPKDAKAKEVKDDMGKDAQRACDPSQPMSAYVFKTVVDPYAGVISLVYVNSGTLRVGEEVSINGRNTVRIGTLYVMTGKNLVAVDEASAGDIAALTRLEGVNSTDTLSNVKSPVVITPYQYPSAVLFKAIVMKNKNDESKIGPALAKMALEDPTVEVKRNTETKQLLLGGVSNTHVDYVLSKLKDIYKNDVNVEPMKVVYRESIKGTGEAEGRYVKQSGGSGFYGVVVMRFEPSGSEENLFAEEVFGGAVPKNYFPAVEKGFYETLKSGPLAGFPVIGVKGILTDGKYHPVDSNEQAFKLAASIAFKNAYPKCKPIILEPIMKIVVSVEAKYTGDIISDLNTRRARVQNILEGAHGTQDIEALVPEAEIVDYVTQLKSITQASGSFSRTFESYEEVPQYLVEKVIRDNKVENN